MIVKIFKEFSSFSILKPNITKCEISGLGPLKGVLEAVCFLKAAYLTNDANKILGINFSYHKEIKTAKLFKHC